MNNVVRMHVLISGRVQGVGFRYYARSHADRLGITGWVCNCPDGRVEAEVQGRSADVDALLDELRHGPRLGHVEEFLCNQIPAVDGEESFLITD
jgi:acylphosphatase